MGRILDKMRVQSARMINKGGYESDIRFVAKNVIIKGIATKHFNSVDTDGIPVIAKNVHITVNEQDLVGKGIVTRNANNEVSLTNTIVEYVDSANITRKYAITETMPNETLGHIVCILTDVR